MKASNHILNRIAFSKDGRYLRSGSIDQSIAIWDLKTGKLAKNLFEHDGGIVCINFSDDGIISSVEAMTAPKNLGFEFVVR